MAAIFSPFPGCARTPSPSCSPSSTRCFFKNRSGLGAQSSGLFCSERSDLPKTFHKKDKQFVRSRLRLNVACRAGMIMMPISVPIVPYRMPGGGYQWIDLNNALVQPSLQIYDTMGSLSSPISTFALGYLCNLSGYILAAGDKGKRYTMPTSVITFEPIAGAARGNADDIMNEANELARIRDYLFKQLELKTGQPFEKIKKDMARRKLFAAQAAIDYGLVDQMVPPPRKDKKIEKIGDGLG
ncbi:ATP-dependent Clp protease proteolytic subunit-related protein 2, chloroplastic isoform X5 [Cryptomeria japonica]|uniref:ATP-dependent Clp protease proteolytic subunit-related protein 2, chloroplastic isoform X5 n=1 Tax=Cryptomeria japonica TaxID=3369 RepID=UPI0027DA7B0C|nr:ATP-dependent Clp protease proteolytic subunit-related protein 2, chloroplastic isoform X5 [Cryptomeria japonica]